MLTVPTPFLQDNIVPWRMEYVGYCSHTVIINTIVHERYKHTVFTEHVVLYFTIDDELSEKNYQDISG